MNHRDSSGFGWMFELLVTAFCRNEKPAVSLNPLYDLSAIHVYFYTHD